MTVLERIQAARGQKAAVNSQTPQPPTKQNPTAASRYTLPRGTDFLQPVQVVGEKRAAEGRTWRKTLPTAQEAEQLQTQRAAAKRANLQPLTRSSAQAEREAAAETQEARRQLAGLQRGLEYAPGLEEQITRQQSRVAQAETRESRMKQDFQEGRNRFYYTGLADKRAALEREAGGLLQPTENWDASVFMPGGGEGAQIALLVSGHVGRNRDAVSAAGGSAPETLDETTLAFAARGRYKNLAYLEEGEKKALLAFAAAGQFDKVKEYYATIERDLNARMHEAGRERLNEAPGAGGTALRAAAPVLANLGAPAAYAEVWGTQLRNMVGEYEPVDMNKGAISSLRLGNEAQARTIEDLEQAVVKRTGNQGLADAAGFLTETGYSILNNAINLVWGPELALPMMGLQAAGQSTVGALEKGAETGQALATGTLSGAIEVITEKIPVDNLFRLIGSTGGRTTRQAIMEVLKQAGIEATEETVGAYMDLLNDITLMGDKSDYAQYKAQLMEEGLSEAEAEREANTRFFVVEPLKNGLAGAISGGVMGGVGTAFSEGSTRIENRRTGRAIDDAYSAMQQNGMFSPEAQGARQGAAARLGMETTQRAAPLENIPLPTYAQEEAALRYLDAAGESPSYTSGGAPGQQATGENMGVQARSRDGSMEYSEYVPGSIAQEDVQQGIQDVARLMPVKEITGEEFKKGEVDLITQVSSFFDSVGNHAYNQQLGDIILDRSGVGDDIAHGIGRKKAAAFAAVPEVLRYGKVIDYQTDWKGRGYDTAVVAAPVTIGGEPYLEGIILVRKSETNRFYVHEVLTEKEGEPPFKTGGATPKSGGDSGGNSPSVLSLLRQVENVKRGISGGGAAQARQQETVTMKRTEPSAALSGFKAGTTEAGAPFTTSIADQVAEVNPDMVGNHAGVQAAGEGAPVTTEGAAHAESDGHTPAAAEDGYWESLMQEDPAPEAAADIPGYMDALLDWVAGKTDGFEPKEASVLTRNTPQEQSRREKAGEAWSFFKRKMVDAGDTVSRVAKAAGDKYLYPYYNYARVATQAAENMIVPKGAQTDISGKRVGPSVADLWEPIRAKGDEYYRAFQEYLYHQHNIDRMSRTNPTEIGDTVLRREAFTQAHPELAYQTEGTLWKLVKEDGPDAPLAREYLLLVQAEDRAKNRQNKPVFGWEVDADKSKDAVQRYEREHPEFKKFAEQVYQYNRNLMEYRVDSGLLSREQADYIESVYPHYVPTYRVGTEKTGGRSTKGIQVGKTVGRAEGGSSDLMPLHTAMARQTMQVVREGSKNRFGLRLMETAKTEEVKKRIRNIHEYERAVNPDAFDVLEDTTPQRSNTFTVYDGGRAWTMDLDPGLYEGIKAISPDRTESNTATRVIRTANDLFKRLVTGYNPMFTARNFARDLQDAGLYSKDAAAWAKNYPLAWKEIVTEGPYWQQYKALGGTYSSIFDYDQGYRTNDERSVLKRQTVDRIEAINMAVEQAPRLAEFMATVKKGDGSMDNLMEAMYNAADVTVNFGRGGTIGKMLNQNFVPFLNPGIQGFDKMVRRVTETKGAKEWGKLAVRCAALGILPSVLNALLYRDDPEWEDLRESDIDTNYLFKVGDGLWFKLPKGRTLSLLGMAVGRGADLARGKDVDWPGFLRTAANQVAPANPLENNILAAWSDADLFDANSPGKTWYGSDIEGQRLRNYEPGQRYDESTDIFSKWLGGVLNLSPKKINYLLDQYSGVVGDFVLPLLTPRAEQNPFANAFVLDSTTSNRISGDFYDTADSIKYAKNGGDGPMSIVNRFWNAQSGAVSDIYAQIREIENNPDLSDAEKREQVRQAKAILNGIQKNALEVLANYEEAARKHFTGEDDKELDEAYLQTNREVFGAEYALEVYNKKVYQRAVLLNRQGVSFETYFDVYFEMQDAEKTSDKLDVLMGKSLSDDEKIALYRDRISDKRDDDISTVSGAGISFDGFLEAQSAYLKINDMSKTGTQKATEFARWLNQKGYQGEQYSVLRDTFMFGTFMPNDETMYEKLVGKGFEDDRAYTLAQSLSEVNSIRGDKDENGKTVPLSSSQKKKSAIDAATPWATQEQRQILYEMFGVSEKVWGTSAQAGGRPSALERIQSARGAGGGSSVSEGQRNRAPTALERIQAARGGT